MTVTVTVVGCSEGEGRCGPPRAEAPSSPAMVARAVFLPPAPDAGGDQLRFEIAAGA